MFLLLFFFIYISNYIVNLTIKNFTEIIYFHCTYTIPFFHSVNGCTAYIIFIYQSISCNIFFFECFPEGLITNQISLPPKMFYNISINVKITVDNSHKYDYNVKVGKNSMSKKYIFIIISCCSLCLGGTIYLIYRENTYISNLVEIVVSLDVIRSYKLFENSTFLNGYLCDYLWALSFASALNFLFYEEKRLYIIYPFVFLCGVIWEIAQLKELVSGVFDFTDIVMYLTAVLAVVMINKFLRRK